MATPQDELKLEEIRKKVKSIKTTYYSARTVLCIIFLLAVVAGASASPYGGYSDAAYIVGAFTFTISLILWGYGNYKIKKYQEQAMSIFINVGLQERFGIDRNRRQEPQPHQEPEMTSYQTYPPNPQIAFEPSTIEPGRIPTTTHNYCPICNQDINIYDELFICPKCQFTAHKSHFTVWFVRNKTCPSCQCEIN